MSFFATGNRGIESTTVGIQVTLSTTTLLAEVDVNGTNASLYPGGQVWGVSWIVGTPAAAATFLLDHALSTGTASTGIINQTVVSLSSGQTGQYFTKHNLESSQVTAPQGHRFRVRLASSIVSAHAKIIAEPLC
jgi:hypothetical protein